MSAKHDASQCLWRRLSPIINLEQLQMNPSIVSKSSLTLSWFLIHVHALCLVGRLGQFPGAQLSAVAYMIIFYPET